MIQKVKIKKNNSKKKVYYEYIFILLRDSDSISTTPTHIGVM